MTGNEKISAPDKKKKKRILIVVLIVVTLLAGVSYVMTLKPDLIAGLFSRKKAAHSGPTSMYSDELRSYVFYPSDYSLDPTKDEEYMGLDRQLWYHAGGVGVGGPLEDDGSWNGYNDAVRFFTKYFRTVIAGDAGTYNTFFTDRYFRDADPYVRFAPQMLYDIHVYELSETTGQDGTTTWTFQVEYRIHRNDGTFRNDMDSDGVRPLLFVLYGDAEGNVKIDSIEYYRKK